MANRSYLFNLDFNRLERPKTKEDKMNGVSEYAYEIPIAYKVLTSANPVNSFSILWNHEHPISIFGDAKEGVDRLLSFLEELRSKNLFIAEYLDEQIRITKEFFTKNNNGLNYFFLECGEIYTMTDEAIEEQNLSVFKEVQSIDKTIDKFYRALGLINQEVKHLTEQKDEMTKKSWFKKSQYILSDEERNQLEKKITNKIYERRAMLGIDNWSTVLYFSFG